MYHHLGLHQIKAMPMFMCIGRRQDAENIKFKLNFYIYIYFEYIVKLISFVYVFFISEKNDILFHHTYLCKIFNNLKTVYSLLI